MAELAMREVEPGEIPPNGGSALQDDPNRPVFYGVGENNYVCGNCGNLLAEHVSPAQMTIKVRVRCGKCASIQVALQPEPEEGAPKKQGPRH
jgi:ribosomal protein S27AE